MVHFLPVPMELEKVAFKKISASLFIELWSSHTECWGFSNSKIAKQETKRQSRVKKKRIRVLAMAWKSKVKSNKSL